MAPVSIATEFYYSFQKVPAAQLPGSAALALLTEVHQQEPEPQHTQAGEPRQPWAPPAVLRARTTSRPGAHGPAPESRAPSVGLVSACAARENAEARPEVPVLPELFPGSQTVVSSVVGLVFSPSSRGRLIKWNVGSQ